MSRSKTNKSHRAGAFWPIHFVGLWSMAQWHGDMGQRQRNPSEEKRASNRLGIEHGYKAVCSSSVVILFLFSWMQIAYICIRMYLWNPWMLKAATQRQAETRRCCERDGPRLCVLNIFDRTVCVRKHPAVLSEGYAMHVRARTWKKCMAVEFLLEVCAQTWSIVHRKVG